MRTNILINILLEGLVVNRVEIEKKMSLSESSVRKLIKAANLTGAGHGFQIQLMKGKGYILHVNDESLLKTYIRENRHNSLDVYNPEQRLKMILFYILQDNGYITIHQLIKYTKVSRTTIINDLKWIEKKLAKINLTLEKKAHYGISVKGSEQDYRKAFRKYVLGSSIFLEPVKEYKHFLESLDEKNLEYVLCKALSVNNCCISDMAFENLITDLKILIFRATERNFISNELFSSTKIYDAYYQVASFVSDWLFHEFHLSLPDSEINFLATHISAKAFTTNIDTHEKNASLEAINEVLKQLDHEFLTSFKEDIDLVHALLLHMYPLQNRLYYNLELENPIIEQIYTKYANVFVVSYRFGELIEQRYGYCLSRDEIGYLALHFAAHFERMQNYFLKEVKRIVIICTTFGGSAHLLRLKMESIFAKAIVLTTALKDISDFDLKLPDLFLSAAGPIEDSYKGVPVIHIKEFLDEDEIGKIKQQVMLQFSGQLQEQEALNIHTLFSKELFHRVRSGNYLDILKQQADHMIKEGSASKGFTKQVLKREKKFSTIYQNGIAGPHPMEFDATRDSVGVTILEEPIEWQGRSVQIIFLINLKQGYLFLYKEISRLLSYLIENDTAREKLLKSLSFEQFIGELEKLM